MQEKEGYLRRIEIFLLVPAFLASAASSWFAWQSAEQAREANRIALGEDRIATFRPSRIGFTNARAYACEGEKIVLVYTISNEFHAGRNIESVELNVWSNNDPNTSRAFRPHGTFEKLRNINYTELPDTYSGAPESYNPLRDNPNFGYYGGASLPGKTTSIFYHAFLPAGISCDGQNTASPFLITDQEYRAVLSIKAFDQEELVKSDPFCFTASFMAPSSIQFREVRTCN